MTNNFKKLNFQFCNTLKVQMTLLKSEISSVIKKSESLLLIGNK